MSETSGKAANFCGSCGTAIHGANFCSECGTPSGVHQAITPAMAAAALREPETARFERPEQAEAGQAHAAAQEARHRHVGGDRRQRRGAGRRRDRRGRRADKFGQLARAGRDRGPQRVYQQQVAKAFGPVLGANQQVSDQLAALQRDAAQQPRGSRSAGRSRRPRRRPARSARCTVPRGQERLASAASRCSTARSPTWPAVAAVLSHPTVAGASQMQTLSSNLTSALTAAGPTVAGEQPTVSGADRLTAWARTTVADAEPARGGQARQGAARARARRARSGCSGGGTGVGGEPATATGPAAAAACTPARTRPARSPRTSATRTTRRPGRERRCGSTAR